MILLTFLPVTLPSGVPKRHRPIKASSVNPNLFRENLLELPPHVFDEADIDAVPYAKNYCEVFSEFFDEF